VESEDICPRTVKNPEITITTIEITIIVMVIATATGIMITEDRITITVADKMGITRIGTITLPNHNNNRIITRSITFRQTTLNQK